MDEIRIVPLEKKQLYRTAFINRSDEAFFASIGSDIDSTLEGHYAVWRGYEWATNFKPEDI